MKIALKACFAVTIAAAATSASAQDFTLLQSPDPPNVELASGLVNTSGFALDALATVPYGSLTPAWAPSSSGPLTIEDIPAGVPLRVQLDKSYRMRVGTRVEGRLTEPVYLADHVVLPADSKVYGRISGKHSVSRHSRAAAIFNGDLTPLNDAEVTFTEVETPAGRDFQIETNATERTAQVAHIAGESAKRSFGQRISAAFRWTRKQAAGALAMDHRSDRMRQMLYEQVPFHPQELWAGTQFDAELIKPVEITTQEVPAMAPIDDLSELKLTGSIEARLLNSLDSATARPGTPVEAVLTQPLFESEPHEQHEPRQGAALAPPGHGRLLLPEGTHLIGSVVRAKSAGMFGHNGSLRLIFRKAELPAGSERVVHGHLIAAEGQASARLRIDEEGGIRATTGAGRFMAPLSLGALQAVGNNTGAGLVHEALAGNGLDMVTRVVGTALSDGGLITGFGYYEAGKVVFDQWIARGHDVVFPRNTRVEIELAQR